MYLGFDVRDEFICHAVPVGGISLPCRTEKDGCARSSHSWLDYSECATVISSKDLGRARSGFARFRKLRHVI